MSLQNRIDKQHVLSYDDMILNVLRQTKNSVSFNTLLVLTGLRKDRLSKRLSTLKKQKVVKLTTIQKNSFWKIKTVKK